MSDEPKKLTRKQIRFAQAYARLPNGALAAREAGIAPKNAARTACRWLNDDRYSHVLAYVDELLADSEAQRKIDHDLLKQRIRHRLQVDQRGYWTEDGKPVNPTQLSQEQAQHIQSYSYSSYRTKDKHGNVVQEGENIAMSLSSDKKAEEMLGRHSGFFRQDEKGDHFGDYLQADQELEGTLSQFDEDFGFLDDEEDAPDDEAAG